MDERTVDFCVLPSSLRAERHGAIAVLRLHRAEKRNALNDPTVQGMVAFFESLPDDIRCVVIAGDGEHFSAGLDLSELKELDVREGIAHSSSWHRAFDRIQYGKAPVIAVLHGAVVGAGLELAASVHIRVAERSAYYGLPEGSRGIFVGGGGSVRLPPLIGVPRMMDMRLTGRTLSAEDGHAIGLSQYLVDNGGGLSKGIELAKRVAANAPFTNFAVTHMLPRIANADPAMGFATEALTAGIAQAEKEAKQRLQDFLEKRGPKVVRS